MIQKEKRVTQTKTAVLQVIEHLRYLDYRHVQNVAEPKSERESHEISSDPRIM